MSQLKIKSKARCTPPTILSVVRSVGSTYNDLTVTWTVNTVDYTGGSLVLEMSVNGGASYLFVESLSPAATGILINANIGLLSTIPNGSQVIFRLVGNTLSCSNMVSAGYKIVWTRTKTPNYDYVVPYSCEAHGDPYSYFDVTCWGKDQFTLRNFIGITGLYRMKTSGDTNFFGMTRQNNSTIANGDSISDTESLFINYSQSGIGSPGSWPGPYLPLPEVIYVLEYSTDNGVTWNAFTIKFKA